MRLLVRKVATALLLAAAILAPMGWALQRAKERVLASPAFVLPPDVDTLMVGDSHIEVALNPATWRGAANLAKSGESYFYTYYKLRHFLDRNPKVRVVILGCSWHNFARAYQEAFLTGDRASSEEDYFLFLDGEARAVIRRWHPDYLVPYLTYSVGLPLGFYKNRALQKALLGRSLSARDIPAFGGYKGSTHSEVVQEKVAAKLTRYFGAAGAVTDVAPVMVTYLKKIVAMCDDRHVAVVLLNTPTHALYRNRVSAMFKDQVSSIITENAAGPQVRYVDLSGMDLPTADYMDGDHVNQLGAEAVRLALVAELQRGDGGSSSEQAAPRQ